MYVDTGRDLGTGVDRDPVCTTGPSYVTGRVSVENYSHNININLRPTGEVGTW